MQLFPEICAKNSCLEKWCEKCAYLAYFHHHVYHVYMYTPEESVAVGETREMKIFFVPQNFFIFLLSLTFIIQTFSKKVYKVYIVYIIVRNVEI